MARVTVMNVVLARFLPLASRNITAMAQASGVQMGVRSWLRVLWLLFGQPGFLRAALPPLLAYCRPGYTGQRAADGALVRQGREALAADLGEGAVAGVSRLRASGTANVPA